AYERCPFPYLFSVRPIDRSGRGVGGTAAGNGAHMPRNRTVWVFERERNHLQVLVPVTEGCFMVSPYSHSNVASLLWSSLFMMALMPGSSARGYPLPSGSPTACA